MQKEKYKISLKLQIIPSIVGTVHEVTKLVDLPDCPKYFLWLPTNSKNSTSFQKFLNEKEKNYLTSKVFREINLQYDILL